MYMCAKMLQSCLTLCDPMDCSQPGPSVHGISQARRLEWVAHALLQGNFLTQGWNPCLSGLLRRQVGSVPLAPPGKPEGLSFCYWLSRPAGLACPGIQRPQ